MELKDLTNEQLQQILEKAGAALEKPAAKGEESDSGDDVRTLLAELGIELKEPGKIATVNRARAAEPEDEPFGGDPKAAKHDDAELKNFSIAKATKYVLTGQRRGAELEADWIKREGFPRSDTKDLNLETDVAGGFLVPTVTLNDLITTLSAQAVMRRMGSMILPNAAKETIIPRKTGSTTAYWVGDAPTSDVTESAMTFGELTLNLRNLAARVLIRRNLIKYATLSAEEIVRADIVEQMALAEDLAFIQGTGGVQPLGLKNYKGASTYTTSSVGTPDFDEMLNAQTALATRNVSVSPTQSCWIMPPSVLGYLQKHKTGVGAYDYVIDLTMLPRDRILGLPVFTTTQIPTNLGVGGDETYVILVGNRRSYAIADGTGLEILVDPYTYSAKFQIQLVALHEVDAGPRRIEEFQFLTGVKTA